MKRLLLLAVAAALPLSALAQTATWNIDPAHSDTSFAIKHLVISTVRGHFGKTTGTLQIDEKDQAKSSVEAMVDTTTIDTRVAARDADLKSPNFFDVAQYPLTATAPACYNCHVGVFEDMLVDNRQERGQRCCRQCIVCPHSQNR